MTVKEIQKTVYELSCEVRKLRENDAKNQTLFEAEKCLRKLDLLLESLR